MNIAFDAKRAFLNASGLGNYSRSLIQSLSFNYPEHQYTLFTTQIVDNAFYKTISQQKNIDIILPNKNSPLKFWRAFKITQQLKKTDIYHGLSNELPFNIKNFNGKKIVTIHDLIFLRYPHLYSLFDRTIYNAKFKLACTQADWIVAVSEQTKKDIIHFYNINPEKIKVIYQSCDTTYYNELSHSDVLQAKIKYNLPQNYLLYVGTIEERKNLLTIIKSLRILNNKYLVVVGKKKKYFKKVMDYINQHNLNKQVLFLENIPAFDLPHIYMGADVFIYPSIFEGFGIPIIEALTCKIPVITSKIDCLKEAGGESSLYINPHNEVELATAVNKILNSKEYKIDIVEKGYEYSKKFSPPIIANQMMSLYTI